MPTATPAPADLRIPTAFAALRQQLLAAAERFAGDPGGLDALLAGLVADVERGVGERLEIFPVCHHSPAAAVHLVRRIRRRPPKVVYIELCEDLLPVVQKLRDCKLPVALQAFAARSDDFPASWAPLSVVAPLTAFSAEYQAIAYCMENPGTRLVFVDRSVDHVFQWTPREEDAVAKMVPEGALPDEEGSIGEAASGDSDDGEGTAPVVSHGAAVGVQVGNIEPTFPLFRHFLLRSARVKHFAEWWDRYVEQPLLRADYATYRQVMCLIGGLFRRLGRRDKDVETDRLRERYMWTRMKEDLAKHKIDPADALHICGAFHAVSDVPEFGTATDARWEIPAPSNTSWLYGLLPSSYRAIDWQFAMPPGSVTLAESLWERAQRASGLKAFVLAKVDAETGEVKGKKEKAGKGARGKPVPAAAEGGEGAEVEEEASSGAGAAPDVGLSDASATAVLEYLTRPQVFDDADHEQLLAWCVGIVNLARRNGYLGSTADAIAVYQTAVLLAQLRNRTSPTAYDFRDAAVTCLEKDRTPKKRDVAKLCDVLLGGDRVGQVGRTSLPPLAQNVYDRLGRLGVNLQATTVQRALLDINAKPQLAEASDLLWKLWYLLGDPSVKPIMGQKALGHRPIQESWELYLGRNQGPLIVLGYEGVTVEQVLEKRVRAKAFGDEADAATALAAAEESVLFLSSPRLTTELGERAIELLGREAGAQSAPQIFDRARRLIHYYRSTPAGLPEWVSRLVTTGYAHYATLLPGSLADRGTRPEQVASMLAFVFTLESLALSHGCSRSQLLIAVKQSANVTDDPNKLGLLWTAEWLLGLRTADQIRAFFDELLDNALAAESMPAYLNGHLLALKFTPLAGPLVVELVSKAFAKLPEPLLMPWMPSLIMMLRQHGGDLLPQLMREAGRAFPRKLAELPEWRMPWEQPADVAPPADGAEGSAAGTAAKEADLSPEESAAAGLLSAHRGGTGSMCALLGASPAWPAAAVPQGPRPTTANASASEPGADAAAELLKAHPAGLGALARLT